MVRTQPNFLFSLTACLILSVECDWCERALAEPAAEKSSLATAAPGESPVPLSLAESLAAIRIRDGFRVELVAAEPLVSDPVAIDWGPDARLWVAEMADYPLGVDNHGKPGGRIRYLEDLDQDGTYDKSTLFLDNVSFPTGIMSWRNGVLVTAAPEIFYAEDSDGDGRADKRHVLYSGFHQGNQQLRVNGLRWGLDNWVYCASGSHHAGYGQGNQVFSHLTNEIVPIGSRDFRFRPDEGTIDPQSGPSQFGRNRDEWGNWFGVQNSHPLWHYVLADHYIRRNPHFAPPDPRRQIITPKNPRVYPAKATQKRFHSFEHSGRFTSACSGMIYRDNLLFSRDDGQHAFTCEPFHNVVQHNVITHDGVSFAFHRDPAEGNVDFFASADRWCRPVMVRTGPDGALWVVDMYRYVIEHPDFLPESGKAELRPFFRLGDNRGRIYRIVSRSGKPRVPQRLDRLTTQQLVAVLESPNGPQRDLAQRLLVAGKDLSAVAHLEAMVRGGKHPLGRLQALCTLDGLGALSADLVVSALSDEHPSVRRQAVRLASDRQIEPARLTRMVADPDAKVRLQLACTLGDVVGPQVGGALAKLAIAAGKDEYMTAAVMSSLNRRNLPDVIAALPAPSDVPPESSGTLAQLVAQAAALGDEQVVGAALRVATSAQASSYETWQLLALAELLDALEKRETSFAQNVLAIHGDCLAQTTNRARLVATDLHDADALRAAAVRLLLREPENRAADGQLLRRLLVPQTPLAVQRAIVAHVATRTDEFLAGVLLDGWSSSGPSLRAEILSVVASRRPWAVTLLGRLEHQQIPTAEIGPSMRQRLSNLPSDALRAKFERILATGTTVTRRQVIEEFRPALELAGDAERGRAIFEKSCALCHRHGKAGSDVGPNMASLSSKSPESILSSILDPNAAVEAKYVSYLVITTDGRALSGILSSETASSITLLASEGRRESVLRSDIDELQSTNQSLMPEGLEKELSRQDVADLMGFISSGSADTD